MCFTVVYVLSCGNSGFYPEQCLMSLHTLKKYNPDISVCVVIDEQTSLVLAKTQYDAIYQYADIITRPVPSEFNTEKLRSRYLKTSLRRIVCGDFVFLDCDTIVCRPFTKSDLKNTVIGMIADLNAPLPLSDPGALMKCQNAGFPDLQGVPYFNSGFFYVKDDPACYHFFDTWHMLWRESTQRGCSFDQPALCETNKRLGFPIQELPGEWNCQIKYPNSRLSLSRAFVLHYFSADGLSSRSFHEDYLLKRVKYNGIDDTVAAILSSSVAALAAFFGQQTDAALRYLGSDLFSVYSEDKPSYVIAERIAVALSKMKQKGRELFWGRE